MFNWRSRVVGRDDVFHAHWPEVMVRRDGRAARLAARARFVLRLLRLQADRRVAVVRTLHNVAAHESASRVERLLLGWLDRRTDAWVALNDATPVRTRRGGPSSATVTTRLVRRARGAGRGAGAGCCTSA